MLVVLVIINGTCADERAREHLRAIKVGVSFLMGNSAFVCVCGGGGMPQQTEVREMKGDAANGHKVGLGSNLSRTLTNDCQSALKSRSDS